MNTGAYLRNTGTGGFAGVGRNKRRSGLFNAGRKREPGSGAAADELMNALLEARNEWLDAVSCFEHASEEQLVDYYTYKMKACEARYTYFIKLAKEKGLVCTVPGLPGAV